VAKEKEWQTDLQKMSTWSKQFTDKADKMEGDGGDASPIFKSLATAYQQEFERTKNPYMQQVSTALNGMAELKAKKKPIVGKDRDISVPATTEDIDSLLESTTLSKEVRANLGSWKARIAKMKPNERPLNFQLKYAPDGELVGVKDTYAPAATKVSIHNGTGNGEGGYQATDWNSPKGYFGSMLRANKGETQMRGTLGEMMQFIAKNPGKPLTAFGGGKYGLVQQNELRARLSDFMAKHDLDPSVFADVGAAKTALVDVTKKQAQMTINAGVATKGFKLLGELRKEGDLSSHSIPAINEVVNIFRNITGDDMPGAAAGTLTETLLDYGRVVSGQTTGAGVTKHAQEAAESLMKLRDNPAQFKKKLESYHTLMKARLDEGAMMQRALSSATNPTGEKQPAVNKPDYRSGQPYPAGKKAGGNTPIIRDVHRGADGVVDKLRLSDGSEVEV